MGKDFSSALRPAIVMTILFAALLGLAYPLAMTGIGLGPRILRADTAAAAAVSLWMAAAGDWH